MFQPIRSEKALTCFLASDWLKFELLPKTPYSIPLSKGYDWKNHEIHQIIIFKCLIILD